MDYIQEVEEFTENIFLIKLDTLVKGYDGTDIGYSNQQAQELANRTKWLKANLELLDENIKQQISSIIETESNDITSLNEKLSSVITSVNEVKKNVDSLSDDLNKEIEKTDSLNKDVISLNKSLTEISDNLNNTDKNVDNLNQKLGELTTNLESTDAKVDSLGDELNNATIELSRLDGELTTLDKNVTGINKELDNLNKEIADLESNFNTELNSAKNEINTKIDDKISTAKEEIENDISNLSKNLDSSLSGLQEEQKKLNSSIDSTNTELKSLSSQVVLKDETKTVFGESIVGKGDIALTSKILNNVIKGGAGITISAEKDYLEIINTDPDDSTWELKTFDNAKKGDFFFFKAPENYLSNYMLHNFYRYFDNGKYKDPVVREYTGSVLDDLIKNETINVDDRGRITGADTYKIRIDGDGNGVQTASINVTQPSTDLYRMRIVAEMDASATVVNSLSSEDDAAKYGYTIFSIPIYNGYNAWNTFRAPIPSNQLNNVQAYTYWSAQNVFNSYKTDVYAGIVLDKSVYIQGYKMQRMDSYWTGYSTLAKSWRFEASVDENSDTTNWVILDTQTNVDLTTKGGSEEDGFKVFKLPVGKEGLYRSFRVVITDVLNPSVRPCLSRLNLIAAPPLLLEDKESENSYYTFNELGEKKEVVIDDNSAVSTILYNNGFYDSKDFEITDVKDINKYNLISNAKPEISIYSYTRKIQIRVDEDIEKDRYAVLCIADITPIVSDGTAFDPRIALITDEKEWYVYENNEWKMIALAPEEDTSYDSIATMLYDSGMKLEDFNNIPEESIIDFVSDLTGPTPSVSIAYATFNEFISDRVVPDNVTITYGKETGWEPVDKDNIKIKFLNKRMIIEVIVDGSYKLLYNFFDDKS